MDLEKTVCPGHIEHHTPSTTLQDYKDCLQRTLYKLSSLNITDCVTVNLSGPRVDRGGFGDVFIGSFKIGGRGEVKVAVKRLRLGMGDQSWTTKLVAKEINTWSKLLHPNIVMLYGYYLDESGTLAIVSEWMDNGPVLQYVKCHPECDVVHLAVGIAAGLTYLHEKDVVHADIKSGNVLVNSSGDAAICDFGISRTMNASEPTLAGNTSPRGGVMGSIRWLSYELLCHSEIYTKHTKESDVWAFGMTLYELLAKEHPYAHIRIDAQVAISIFRKELPRPPTPVNTWPERLQNVWELCKSCWTLDPRSRISMSVALKTLKGLNTKLPEPPELLGDSLNRLDHLNLKERVSVNFSLPRVGGDTFNDLYLDRTGFPATVSEWMDNRSVLEYTKDHPDCDVLHLIIGIAKGIEYLHQNNVVHGDIKSDNILVNSLGDAVVHGFEISRAMDATQASLGGNTTNPNGPAGTARWIAYELLAESETYTKHSKESDVWAFGMTVYELLAKERPYADIFIPAQIVHNVMHKKLPPLPISFNSLPLELQETWGLCKACWIFNPQRRISMANSVKWLDILRRLSSIPGDPIRIRWQDVPSRSPSGSGFLSRFLVGLR
ncbi:hypothetical protein M0805_009706 [Coniferiporia weirii]|nr:hypothetical protein M0805_009706 [Coniferiporia weirii]